MAYPHDHITAGERVVLHQHPHWKTLLVPFTLGTVIVAGAGWLGVTVDTPLVWYALAAVAALAGIYFGLAPWLRWRATHFVLTDTKMMIREGVLRRTGMNIPLKRITSVQTEIDLNDRLFRCGSLIVESASGEPLRFNDIAHVDHVYNLLYQAVDGDHGLTAA